MSVNTKIIISSLLRNQDMIFYDFLNLTHNPKPNEQLIIDSPNTLEAAKCTSACTDEMYFVLPCQKPDDTKKVKDNNKSKTSLDQWKV